METIENKFITLSITANSYTVREETLDGRKHLVVPVVMMVEGVHSGSHGPMLHEGAELEKWTEAWNGIPVTVDHPQEGGKDVSVNSPEVLDQSVGRIFNTVYENGLRAEAWIDSEKIKERSSETLGILMNEEPLEVSVGVFNDTIAAEEGAQWQGETYGSIASNYRPDHLALLPDEQGACSVDDGCGVRVNKKGVDVKELFQTFKKLSQQGYVVSLLNNAQGYYETLELLRSKLNDLDTEDSYHYLEEVYDDYIVYREMIVGGGETLYRQDYNMDNEENIVFNGMSSEVKKKVEYVTMKMKRARHTNNSANEKGDKSMSTDKSLCCEAKVDALIANKMTHWQASDREWLLEQEEGTIAKMSPMVPEEAELSAEEIQTNKDSVIAEYKEGLTTIDDFTAIMPEEMKAKFDGGIKLYKEHREALVTGIIANTDKDTWKQEELEEMDDKTLESISKSIKHPADYSAQGAGGNGAADGPEGVEVPVEYSRDGKEDK